MVAFDRHLAVPDEAAAALADFDVVCLMRERMPMPRALIERLPRLKLIVMTGSQSQSIDFAAAAERGIPVCRTTTQRVACDRRACLGPDHLRACAASRRRRENMRRGGWQSTVGTSLHGKTLGLLGLGSLGTVVAGYGNAFGMRVLAWSHNLDDARAAAAGATRVGKEDLLRQSDVVSIHLKLSARTRGLIGAAEFALMKPSAIFVNTSRGPIVDEAALVAALERRQIKAAALDVFDQEPLPPDHVLRRLDNAILTPHLGYVTEETLRNFYEGVVEDIEAWRAGTPIRLYGGFNTN